jgi:hypothetical protein
LVEPLLAARRAAIISLALVRTLRGGLPLVDLHLTHRILAIWIPPLLIYSASCYSRSALAMTETELKVIAALAIIGLNSSPKTG